MNSAAFTLGAWMAKEALPSPLRIARGKALMKQLSTRAAKAGIDPRYTRGGQKRVNINVGSGDVLPKKRHAPSAARSAQGKALAQRLEAQAAQAGVDPRYAPVPAAEAAAHFAPKPFNIDQASRNVENAIASVPVAPLDTSKFITPATGTTTKGFFPRISEALFGPKSVRMADAATKAQIAANKPVAPKGLLGGLGGAGRLGLAAAGGLGLWNMARTGSPFSHDMGRGAGGMMGSGARNIAQNDPLAQFGGMEPASANYWDQVTMAALQREAQSQNALERIRMLRRLGTGA